MVNNTIVTHFEHQLSSKETKKFSALDRLIFGAAACYRSRFIPEGYQFGRSEQLEGEFSFT